MLQNNLVLRPSSAASKNGYKHNIKLDGMKQGLTESLAIRVWGKNLNLDIGTSTDKKLGNGVQLIHMHTIGYIVTSLHAPNFILLHMCTHSFCSHFSYSCMKNV